MVTSSKRPSMSELELKTFLSAERAALLLACLRNYRVAGHVVDLEGAMGLEPEVSGRLSEVRDLLPRPE